MGHEVAGEIAAVGAGVTRWKPGDRVVPGVSGPCGRCADCHGGRANLCAAGHADRMWGAFAEFVRVPAGVVAVEPPPHPGRPRRRGRGLPRSARFGPPWLEPSARPVRHSPRLRRRSARLPVGRGRAPPRPRGRPRRPTPRAAGLAARYGARFVDLTRQGPEALVAERRRRRTSPSTARATRPSGSCLAGARAAREDRSCSSAAARPARRCFRRGAAPLRRDRRCSGRFTTRRPRPARPSTHSPRARSIRALSSRRGARSRTCRGFPGGAARGEGVRYAILGG